MCVETDPAGGNGREFRRTASEERGVEPSAAARMDDEKRRRASVGSGNRRRESGSGGTDVGRAMTKAPQHGLGTALPKIWRRSQKQHSDSRDALICRPQWSPPTCSQRNTTDANGSPTGQRSVQSIFASAPDLRQRLGWAAGSAVLTGFRSSCEFGKFACVCKRFAIAALVPTVVPAFVGLKSHENASSSTFKGAVEVLHGTSPRAPWPRHARARSGQYPRVRALAGRPLEGRPNVCRPGRVPGPAGRCTGRRDHAPRRAGVGDLDRRAGAAAAWPRLPGDDGNAAGLPRGSSPRRQSADVAVRGHRCDTGS